MGFINRVITCWSRIVECGMQMITPHLWIHLNEYISCIPIWRRFIFIFHIFYILSCKNHAKERLAYLEVAFIHIHYLYIWYTPYIYICIVHSKSADREEQVTLISVTIHRHLILSKLWIQARQLQLEEHLSSLEYLSNFTYGCFPNLIAPSPL